MELRERATVLAICSADTCLSGGRELRVGDREASCTMQAVRSIATIAAYS